MYNILRILAIIILLILIFLIFVGLVAEPQTHISCTEIINSPVTIVWQIITDPEKLPDWYDQVLKVEIESKNPIAKDVVLRLYHSRSGEKNFHEVRVEEFILEKQLSLMRIKSEGNTLLKEYKQDFRLKSLLDGTTEVTHNISYQPATFFTRIFNKLFLQKELRNQCSEMLQKLKQVIEKV
jgi:uncharacterized membrane protein